MQADEGSLAVTAPSIGTGCACIIAPKEADPLTMIDCEGYVLTHEPNALWPMQLAVDTGPSVFHDAQR